MKTIILIIAIMNCLIINAQESIDSTLYFLKYNDTNIKEIDFCINQINKGESDDQHQGVYTIYVSTHENGYTLAISKIYSSWDILNLTPDYYSYFKGKPIVWYLGKSLISNKDFKFADFLINNFKTYLNINISSKEYLNQLNDSVWMNDNTGKRKISANDLMPASSLNAKSNWKPKPPTYVIECINKKVMSIKKKNNIDLINIEVKTELGKFSNIKHKELKQKTIIIE